MVHHIREDKLRHDSVLPIKRMYERDVDDDGYFRMEKQRFKTRPSQQVDFEKPASGKEDPLGEQRKVNLQFKTIKSPIHTRVEIVNKILSARPHWRRKYFVWHWIREHCNRKILLQSIDRVRKRIDQRYFHFGSNLHFPHVHDKQA